MQDGDRSPSSPAAAAARPPLTAADGEPVTVVHVTAEYSPYARTGGLAEAVNGLAGFQAAAGLDVVAILPLYRTVRDVEPDLEPVGPPFLVSIGGRTEEAPVFRWRRRPASSVRSNERRCDPIRRCPGEAGSGR